MIRSKGKNRLKRNTTNDATGFGKSFIRKLRVSLVIAMLFLFFKPVAQEKQPREAGDIVHLAVANSGSHRDSFNFDQSLAEICESEWEKFEEDRFSNSSQLHNGHCFPIYKVSSLAAAQLFSSQKFLAIDLGVLHCSFLL